MSNSGFKTLNCQYCKVLIKTQKRLKYALEPLLLIHNIEQSSFGATNSSRPCAHPLKLVFYRFCFTIKPFIMTTTKKRPPGAPLA